jgi:hypothetical protein
MKPHEETWHWNDDAKQIETRYPDTPEYQRVGLVGSFDRVIVETDSGVYPPHGAEIPLIVQAPAMARLLLERVDNGDSGADDATYYCGWCGRGGEHSSSCRLLAVLHAAGVLP